MLPKGIEEEVEDDSFYELSETDLQSQLSEVEGSILERIQELKDQKTWTKTWNKMSLSLFQFYMLYLLRIMELEG